MQAQTRSSLKERQRQERENLILQIAEEVLLEKGYHETSMDEIAARVGVAKGTVYLHFPSKEELVVAIAARGMEMFLEGAQAAMINEPTNRAKLEAMLHFMYTGLFRKRVQLMSNMFHSSELHRVFMEKKGGMREFHDRAFALVSTVIDAGKAAGEFSTAIPTNVLASVFFSMISPFNYQRLTQEEGFTAEELVQYVRSIYFDGIEKHA